MSLRSFGSWCVTSLTQANLPRLRVRITANCLFDCAGLSWRIVGMGNVDGDLFAIGILQLWIFFAIGSFPFPTVGSTQCVLSQMILWERLHLNTTQRAISCDRQVRNMTHEPGVSASQPTDQK